MNPPCARCNKPVYPVEKMTCLDKVGLHEHCTIRVSPQPRLLHQTWHKACFSCESCGLKLTMKTYKGYNKLPYCTT